MEQGDHTHFVKRVVLPSGKTIEVVYFQDPSDGQQARPAELVEPATETHPVVAEPHQALHECLACGCPLVYPTEWEEAGEENWSVVLHCPNCDVFRDGVFTQATVEAFDQELDRGADQLASDYKRLMRANMATELDRFSAALAADGILPEDF